MIEYYKKDFKVEGVVDEYEGIIVVHLKQSKTTVVLLYQFTSHQNILNMAVILALSEQLIQIMYVYDDCDDVIILGAWNASRGDKCDFICDTDDTSERIHIDDVCNELFPNFHIQSNLPSMATNGSQQKWLM